jgi:nucleotide-binding universal stress UspA family protein
MFTQILTTLDGSEFSERSLVFARYLAKSTGARVTLLSIVETPENGSPSESQQERGKRSHEYLTDKAAFLREDGPAEVDTLVKYGEPAELISETAREIRADLIVMSTEGLGAHGDYALGSVALNVLMTAPCPMFMVRINKPEPPRSVAEERWQGEGGRNVG